MQALQTLLLVIKPHFQHFCLLTCFFFSLILMLSAEQMMSIIDWGRMHYICLISSLTWPRQANGLQMHSVEKQSNFLWQAYMTISFSQAYFKGFTRGRDKGSSSSPEIALAQMPKRLRSPLNMFIRTVSAISSALWPVTTLQQPSLIAPRSRACLRKTPQQVQLFVCPITLTISSIVQPYKSLYDNISRGIPSIF